MNSLRPLSRREASEYLLERHGLRRAPGTLAKLACIGGGPKYRKAPKEAIYDPLHLDEYAASIVSPPAVTSTEHDARPAPVAAKQLEAARRPVVSQKKTKKRSTARAGA